MDIATNDSCIIPLSYYDDDIGISVNLRPYIMKSRYFALLLGAALASMGAPRAAIIDIANEATLLSLLYVPRYNLPEGNVCKEELRRKTNGKLRHFSLYYDQQRLLKIVERNARHHIYQTTTFAYTPDTIRVTSTYRKNHLRETLYVDRKQGEVSLKKFNSGQVVAQAIHLSADEYQINHYQNNGKLEQKKRYQVQQKRFPAATHSFAGSELYHSYKYSWETEGKVMHVTGSSGKLKFAKRDKHNNPLLIKLRVNFDDGKKLEMVEQRKITYCQ